MAASVRVDDLLKGQAAARMRVDEVLGVDVSSEEGGWLVVDTTVRSAGQVAMAAADATSFGYLPPTEQLYAEMLEVEDLADIEHDLLPEDVVRVLFLAVDDLPTSVLQKCLVRMAAMKSGTKPTVDSFYEWACKSADGGWKQPFLEALAVVGRLDVLHVLGLDEQQMRRLQSPVCLSSLKVSLAASCGALRARAVLPREITLPKKNEPIVF